MEEQDSQAGEYEQRLCGYRIKQGARQGQCCGKNALYDCSNLLFVPDKPTPTSIVYCCKRHFDMVRSNYDVRKAHYEKTLQPFTAKEEDDDMDVREVNLKRARPQLAESYSETDAIKRTRTKEALEQGPWTYYAVDAEGVTQEPFSKKEEVEEVQEPVEVKKEKEEELKPEQPDVTYATQEFDQYIDQIVDWYSLQ